MLHVRCMDTFEIALNYADSGHGGDRRKKSQQCRLSTLYPHGFVIILNYFDNFVYMYVVVSI